MSVIRFQVDPSLSDEEIFERLLVLRGKVEKHGGPGPHKGTGTDQSVHGKGGSSYESDEPGTMPTAGPFGSVSDILAMNEKAIEEDENSYPADVQEAAADLLQTGLYREAELSQLIYDAAPDAKFKKPEYRVKLEPSIRSKIVRNQEELRLAGLDDSVEAAAEMVTDLNRYTILADDEEFLTTFESVVDSLDQAGWQSWDHKIKNYFAVRNDSFDGIVSKFRDASGGIVEIQFHTTLSAEKQDLSHEIYTVARELPVGDPRRQELAREMMKLWGTDDHVPPGVFEIGTPTEQIFKHAMHNQKDHGNRYRRYDTLEEMERAGFITDEWAKWQQGYCGTYACALIEDDPSLRLGGLDFENSDEDEYFAPTHYFAHDDKYAYDSAGKHPLPYKGVSGDALQSITDLGDPEDWGILEDEGATPEDIEEAKSHVRRHKVRP